MDDRKMDNITRSLAEATTRRQALKLFGGGALGMAGLAIGAKRADAAPKVNGDSTAVGIGTDANEAPTSVVGQITNLVFSVVDGALVASGTFPGSAPYRGTVRLPGALVTANQASCTILDLTLGPLDLGPARAGGPPEPGRPAHRGDAGPGQSARQPVVCGGEPAQRRDLQQRAGEPAQPDRRPARWLTRVVRIYLHS